MLAYLLFVLFSTFAVLTAPVATGHTHGVIASAQAPVASDDDDDCCGGVVLYFSEDDESFGLAESDGDAGTLIEFQHGLPPEAISVPASPVPSRFTLLRAPSRAPRAPPAWA